MKIKNIKGNIGGNPEFLNILKLSHYNPTDEKLNKIALEYSKNENIHAIACFNDDVMIGFIVVDKISDKAFEIVDIAVNENYRKQGIASKLIDYVIDQFDIKILYAETDDDAVNFYKKYGFSAKLINKRGEFNRYKCKLIL